MGTANMTAQEKKKSQKQGKNSKKLSNQRYKAEMRWLKNAKRKRERHAKRVADKIAHLAARKLPGYSERRLLRKQAFSQQAAL